MTAEAYQKVILAELEGLPTEVMAEIADFVFFMRRKVQEPYAFVAEREQATLHHILQTGRSESLAHLEEEFVDYEQRFPCN